MMHSNRSVPANTFPLHRAITLAIAICAVTVVPVTHAFEVATHPNIVVIMCDDMGYSDLSCYGSEIPTPNLDRLAKEGIRYSRFYNNAKCTESRASLLTGMYYQRTKNLRKRNYMALPEVLKSAGYSTQMVGKWHLPDSPLDNGFERYFGFLGGAIDFWTGRDFSSGKNLMRDGRDVYEAPEGFYSTDAFTDRAIEYLTDASKKEQPFFLYLAHNAPHFPLQAPDDEIAKHRGIYDIGWDKLRDQRFERMKSLGLNVTSKLSERDPHVPAWDSLTKKRQKEEAELMAVYAAMVTRLDSNIGRLTAHLGKLGVASNTLIFFCSDNGGCPYDFNRTPGMRPGPKGSFRSYDSPWANASNTPFRLYKQWSHEGGISSPMIVRWPDGIDSPNRTSDEALHLIDLLPTLAEIAGASVTVDFLNQTPNRIDGISFARTFSEKSLNQNRYLFWQFRGHHGVLDVKSNRKLVAEQGGDWELYSDRLESTPAADTPNVGPSRARLIQAYAEWATEVGAKSHAECKKMGPPTQGR